MCSYIYSLTDWLIYSFILSFHYVAVQFDLLTLIWPSLPNVLFSPHHSEPFIIFSGGLSYDKAGRRPTLTIMHGKAITVLEMDYPIVEFMALCETPYNNGKDIQRLWLNWCLISYGVLDIFFCIIKRTVEKLIIILKIIIKSLSICVVVAWFSSVWLLSYRGPGALCSGCAFGEGLNRGGSDTEQVCVPYIWTHLPAAKQHMTDSKMRASYHVNFWHETISPVVT